MNPLICLFNLSVVIYCKSQRLSVDNLHPPKLQFALTAASLIAFLTYKSRTQLCCAASFVKIHSRREHVTASLTHGSIKNSNLPLGTTQSARNRLSDAPIRRPSKTLALTRTNNDHHKTHPPSTPCIYLCK